MSVEKLESILAEKLETLKQKGALKGREMVITGIKPAVGEKGPRYIIEGFGQKELVRCYLPQGCGPHGWPGMAGEKPPSGQPPVWSQDSTRYGAYQRVADH